MYISPSTIGANANPPTVTSSVPMMGHGGSSGSGSGSGGKDLKDVMNSLGDWKNMLASRRDNDDQRQRERQSSIVGDEKTASPSSASHAHGRKGSATSFIQDKLSSLIPAKDGKPVIENFHKANENAEKEGDIGEAVLENQHSDSNGDNDLPGHPQRLDDIDSAESDAVDWVVDSQGWVYADNHWLVSLDFARGSKLIEKHQGKTFFERRNGKIHPAASLGASRDRCRAYVAARFPPGSERRRRLDYWDGIMRDLPTLKETIIVSICRGQ